MKIIEDNEFQTIQNMLVSRSRKNEAIRSKPLNTRGQSLLANMSQQYDDILEWSAAYEQDRMSAKKEIVSHIIERVDVFRG